MTLQHFETLLDTHGPAFDLWPSSERAGAQALLHASSEARRLVLRAQRFEALLGTALAAEPTAEAVRSSIVRAVAADALRRRSPGWFARQVATSRMVWSAGLAAAAAAAVAGFVAGWTQAGPLPSDDGPDIAGLVWGTASVEGEEG